MYTNHGMDSNDHYEEDEMGLVRDPYADEPQTWYPPNMPPVEPMQPDDTSSELDAKGSSSRKAILRRRIIVAVLAVIVVLIACGGIYGALLYRSAQNIMRTVDEIQGQAQLVKSGLLDGDEEMLRSSTAQVTSQVQEIHDELHSPLWNFTAGVPVYGTEVRNMQTLIDCASDLTSNALLPIVDGVAGIHFSDLMQDGRVNTDIMRASRDSIVAAAPVIVNNANIITSLPPSRIDRINQAMERIQGPLGEASEYLDDADGLFSMLLAMFGDQGQTRTYVILAQANCEIRAGGGFPGSVGYATVTDGFINLSDFHTVSDINEIVRGDKYGAPIRDDEREAFGEVLSGDAAGVTLTPNFIRSGELTRDFWEHSYDMQVDGVFAVDPIFLQRMLGLVGGIVAEDGTEVNGDNAAYELMSNVYWRYGYAKFTGNAIEDAFFNDVAQRAASQVLHNLGNIELEKLTETISQSGTDHRLQVWMRDEREQEFMRDMQVTGELQSDISQPELGIYANDNTWAKMSWYLDISADIDEGTRNEDGTITHHVTARFRNNITNEEAWSAPEYVYGHQPLKRDRGDMVDTTYIMAPIGATISDYAVNEDGEMPAGYTIPDEQMTLYDRDTWRSRINIHASSETTITFNLTLPAEATGPITVRTSPLCHD